MLKLGNMYSIGNLLLIFNPSDYESKQVFYTRKTVTSVPMIIRTEKALALNGKNPKHTLRRYGGFKYQPNTIICFTNAILDWSKVGYAVPKFTRWGGEYR